MSESDCSGVPHKAEVLHLDRLSLESRLCYLLVVCLQEKYIRSASLQTKGRILTPSSGLSAMTQLRCLIYMCMLRTVDILILSKWSFYKVLSLKSQSICLSFNCTKSLACPGLPGVILAYLYPRGHRCLKMPDRTHQRLWKRSRGEPEGLFIHTRNYSHFTC